MDEPGIFISKVSAKQKYFLDSMTGLEKGQTGRPGGASLFSCWAGNFLIPYLFHEMEMNNRCDTKVKN